MKVLVVALALLDPSSAGSLGIGIDVLPEAFVFAARRIGAPADLRLAGCTASRCSWDFGGAVSIAAERSSESLDIARLEATLDRASPASLDRFEQACLVIVSLFDHEAGPAEVNATARAIASPREGDPRTFTVEGARHRISLYGGNDRESGGSRQATSRCGAVAAD